MALLGGAIAMAMNSSAHAGRDFTPQPGTWIISEELNGKPGRGLAIDVQGNTFFMQVFGYEKNGDATFYTATGQMDGNNVTAPLMRYQGGRSFGSEARDAVEDKSLGDVTVRFNNGLNGTVQFPGEPEVAMERFQMMSADFANKYWTEARPRTFKATALDAQLQTSPPVDLELLMSYATMTWMLIVSDNDAGRQRLYCEQHTSRDVFSCSSDGVQPEYYQDLGFRDLQLHIADADVTGSVSALVQGALQTSRIMGITIAASGNGMVITGCGSADYIYVGDYQNCSRRDSTPVSGTWVIEDELLGKPGRGMAIDVQNGMVAAQIFNYLPNGAPTFHMGVGSYQGMAAEFDINRYQGGRYIGGPAASGSWAETAGQVAVRFTADGTTEGQAVRTQGIIQLPGESPKKIVRVALESTPTAPQAMLGQWWLQFVNWTAEGARSEHHLVTLDQIEGDVVRSADGAVRCTRSLASLTSVECSWDRAGEKWTSHFLQEANNRSKRALQVRDRHGNLMGLGNVPLD